MTYIPQTINANTEVIGGVVLKPYEEGQTGFENLPTAPPAVVTPPPTASAPVVSQTPTPDPAAQGGPTPNPGTPSTDPQVVASGSSETEADTEGAVPPTDAVAAP